MYQRTRIIEISIIRKIQQRYSLNRQGIQITLEPDISTRIHDILNPSKGYITFYIIHSKIYDILTLTLDILTWVELHTCLAKIKCSLVCGIVPSVAATTRIAPSSCAAPVIIFLKQNQSIISSYRYFSIIFQHTLI